MKKLLDVLERTDGVQILANYFCDNGLMHGKNNCLAFTVKGLNDVDLVSDFLITETDSLEEFQDLDKAFVDLHTEDRQDTTVFVVCDFYGKCEDTEND